MAQATGTGLLTMLRGPFADPNLRRLITFLGTWNLAVNLAAPFFTVFMLTMLHMDMTMVMGLSVVLLVPNVLLIGVCGAATPISSATDDPGGLRADVHPGDLRVDVRDVSRSTPLHAAHVGCYPLSCYPRSDGSRHGRRDTCVGEHRLKISI